jgi:protein-tyrosine phosphatase
MVNDHTEVPFLNSYWVISEKLLAGEYPFSKDKGEGIKMLARLLQMGIRAIADLTTQGEAVPYIHEITKLAQKNNLKIIYRRIGIQDMSVPEAKTMQTILDWIDFQLSNNPKVYIHCLGGIGRTGTVVGCYLVKHGMSGQEALERITVLRQGTPDWWHKSPETWLQKEFILKWKNEANQFS